MFDPTLNSQQGSYSIDVDVTDPSGKAISGSFNLVVYSNQQPQINTPPGDQSIWALHDFQLLLNITDNEQNPISYDVKKGDGTALPTWLTWDDSTLTFTGLPSNSDVATFDVNVTFWDLYILDAKLDYTFNLEVKTNLPPQISGSLPLVPDITVPSPIDYDNSLIDFFSDRENDEVVFSVTKSPNAPWLNYDTLTSKLSGFPPDNTQAGIYTITMTAQNVFPSTTLTNTQTLTINVIVNAPPIIQTVDNKMALVPEDIIYDFGNNFCTDPEGL